MSKTWKWIVGITLGLVILAGVGFVAASFFGYGPLSFRDGPALYGRPMMDGFGFGDRSPMDGLRTFRHPLRGGRGFGILGLPFLFFGGLLRLIIPLGVLALVTYFSYRAGKQAGWKEAQAARVPEPQEPE